MDSARGLGEGLSPFEWNPSNGRHDHLRDTVAAAHDERLRAKIRENDPDFAFIRCVDGSGSVKDDHAVLQSKAASRAYLDLVSIRDLHAEARGNESAFARLDYHGTRDRCAEVRSGIAVVCVRGKADSDRMRECDELIDAILELYHVKACQSCIF